MKPSIVVFCLCLVAQSAFACEFGKTYRDLYGKPTEHEKRVSAQFPEKALYIEPAKGGNYFYGLDTISDELRFGENDKIEKYTGYTWCGNENPPPEGREPYVLYKGHRWYPQYHGFIYVYRDGHEV